jgi:hypothetical protein
MRWRGWPSWPRHPCSFASQASDAIRFCVVLFILTDYLKVPLGVPERRWWRNTKHIKQGLLLVAGGRSEGESLRSRLRPRLLLHQRLLLAIHHKGNSSPPRLWVCGGNLVQSLYILSLLRSIWCALHDYGTIYVIPMVVIVLWDDMLYIYYCVETLWFVILWDYTYDACN